MVHNYLGSETVPCIWGGLARRNESTVQRLREKGGFSHQPGEEGNTATSRNACPTRANASKKGKGPETESPRWSEGEEQRLEGRGARELTHCLG